MTALIELIRSDVAALKAQAAAAGSDDRAKLEEMAEAVSGALDQFAKSAASEDRGAKSAAFPAAKSMLYSLRAELQGKRKVNAMFVVFGILGNLSLKIPYL